jgi:hypothetical protein
MKKTCEFGCICLLSLLLLAPLAAEEAIKKIYTTKPVNPAPPVIDGKIDEPVWDLVEWSGGFIQREPREGEEPSQETSFKILYDDNNLFVAIRAHDREPNKISKRLGRRDNFDGDWVEINIDSYHDLRTAFSFTVNAAGVKGDEAITGDGENWDKNWDPIWYVKTSTDETGWTAEMRIPFSQLRFASKEKHIWGIQVQRRLFRKEERSVWQFIPRNAPGWVHLFGELHGIQGIKPRQMLQIMPYTVGRLQYFQKEEGNPFATGRLSNVMAGLDGKLGVTRDLTLDFTINPDFGQVEADPSVVNLTAFETYYEEKRPFFIEGQNILDYRWTLGDNPFSNDTLFYTRRIGRVPHHSPSLDSDEYADLPENTTILGAMKLTGKTRSGLSIGILESVTDLERAEIDLFGFRRQETVEPLTNYFVLRLQQDINKGDTIIGGMVTSTHRKLDDDHLDVLHSAAYTGGIDFLHTWKEKTYYFMLTTVFSQVLGSTEAIQLTQKSPVHYYQRPDAEHVTYDPERTSLSGHGGTVALGKQGGNPIQFSLGATWRSPGLELNDVGYLRGADTIMQWIWAQYRITDPFFLFNSIFINVNQGSGWNFQPENIFSGGNVNLHAQFKNQWVIGANFNRDCEGLSSTSLRGGPALLYPGAWNFSLDVISDHRKRVRFNFGVSTYWADDEAQNVDSYWIGMTVQPSNAFTVTLSPTYNINDNILQYVTTEEFGTANRYLFASIDQKTLALTIRFNLNITPNLTIQYYGQPFLSAGQYSDFKRITNSRADILSDRYETLDEDLLSFDPNAEVYLVDEDLDGTTDYSFSNPNFNFLEFRSNLVLRWEYVPGSTVYLVWSQGRTDYFTNGGFHFGNNIADLFDVAPHNVFLIKFSYSFNN